MSKCQTPNVKRKIKVADIDFIIHKNARSQVGEQQMVKTPTVGI